MNARKAHRRWMRWQRYLASTGSRATSNRYGGYMHRGLIMAYSSAMFANRRGYRGPRNPKLLRSTVNEVAYRQ